MCQECSLSKITKTLCPSGVYIQEVKVDNKQKK